MTSSIDAPGLDAIAEALADALIGFDGWVHRRVESIHLHPGERATCRVSLDCTPPPDPALAQEFSERSEELISAVQGSILLPIALLKKAPLRDFDLSDGSGTPLPALLREESSPLVVRATLVLLQRSKIAPNSGLTRAVEEIINGDSDAASSIATSIIESGSYDQNIVLDPTVLEDPVAKMLQTLARNFVLLTLIPSKLAGRRVLIKWSSDMDMEHLNPASQTPWKVALRGRPTEIEWPIFGASDARSFHLEIVVPDDVKCRALVLPAPYTLSDVVVSDHSGRAVAHAHASYALVSDDYAVLRLALPRWGKRLYAALATSFTALATWLAIALPGAQNALLSNRDSAATLLLIAPVLLMTLAATQGDNSWIAALNRPLNIVLGGSALALVTLAATIIGGLTAPFINIVWWAIAISASSFAIALWLPPTRMSEHPGSTEVTSTQEES